MSARIGLAVIAAFAVPILLAGCGVPAPPNSGPGLTPSAAASPSPSPTPSVAAPAPTLPETPVVLTITGGLRHNASGATVTFTYVAHEPQTVGSPEYQQILDTLEAEGDRSLLLDPAWRAENAQYLMIIDVASTTGGAVAWPDIYPLPVYLGALVGVESHTSLGMTVSSREGRFGHGDYVPVGTTGQVIVAQGGGPDGRWDSYPTIFGVPGDTSTLGEIQAFDCVYTPTALASGLESQLTWLVENCSAGFGGE